MFFSIDEIPVADLNFVVKKEKQEFEIDQPGCSLAKDVEVTGTLSVNGKDVYLSGQIKTELALQCSRCLEPYQFPVENKVTAHFIPREEPDKESIEHPEVELSTADIDIEYYDDNRVDITQPVHDQIFLAIPFISVCREDCKGLCAECGNNLNKGACGCSQDGPVDPRLEVLRSLKDKLK
jgi:DUF177 domain-containing protein